MKQLKPLLFLMNQEAFAHFITCVAYSLNWGERASAKQIALAAIVCSCGHHWHPGKTARAICFSYIAFDIIIAHLGHRKVLWVVVVTTSQYGISFQLTPQQDRQYVQYLPLEKLTSSAISLNFPIQGSWICGKTCNNHFWSYFLCYLSHLIHIYSSCFFINSVCFKLI